MNIRIPFLLAIFSLAIPSAVHGQTVTSAAELQAALNTSATPATTSATILFGNSISLSGYSAAGYNAGSGFLGAINAPTSGGVLTVNGAGNSLTGGSNALFFASPENETATGGVSIPTPQNVTIENLTISGATSQGGSSLYGGGGAGLGGGLFVGTGVNMTLNAVTFNGNLAAGGSSSFVGTSYGGGGIGGNSGFFGGSGLYATPTDSFSGGGANGGQGYQGGSGGFGGGGAYPEGAGGFGAGGSAGAPSGFGAGAGYTSTAGFGGGGGYDTTIEGAGAVGGGTFNGGGAGFGGAIFVQNGATLTLTGNDTLSGDTATGGPGTTQGAGVGNEIFMMTGSSVTLAPGAGNTVTIGASGDTGDDIADDSASSLPTGQSYVAGTGAGAGLVLGSSANPNGTVILYGTNTYAAGTTLQDGVTLVVGSSHALGVGALTTTGNTVVYANGVAVANALVMTGDTALEVDDLGSATQGGVISESGASHSFTKTGTGTLILTKANTYSGGTTINSGIIQAENNNALGTGAVTVPSGTTLTLATGITVANDITISGTGTASQGAIYAITGMPFVVTESVGGTVTLAANASVGADNLSSELSLGAVNLQSFTLSTGGTGRVDLNGNITGGGGLTIGSQVYAVGGQNSFTGLTDVLSNADLYLDDSSGVVVSGDLAIEDGAAVFDDLGGQIAPTATVTLNGSAELHLSGGGPETIAGLQGTSGTSLVTIFSGFPSNTPTALTLAGTGMYAYAGQITDSFGAPLSLVKEGSGTQILTGANTYSGGTTISGGVLQLGDGSTAGASLGSGDVTVNGTGTFTLDLANNETFSNNIIDNNHVILDDFVSSNYTVASFISGTGTVVKSGANTITVTGANNYSGGTTVNAGTLVAGNSAAFGTGLMTVNGGTLTTGNNNHLISVGSYAQTAGTLLLNVNGVGQAATADLLHVTNTLPSQVSLGGNLTINLAGFTVPVGATHGAYTFTLVVADEGYNGKFASFDPLGLGSGLRARLNYTTTPDDVLLQIFQAAAGFALTGLTPNQQAIATNLNQNSGSSAPNITKIITALQNLPLGSLPGAFDELSPQAFGQFTSTTAFNNASFETEAQDSYTAGQRIGPNGTFIGGNGSIDASGLTLNDPSYDPTLAMVHSRLLAWNPAPATGMLSDMPGPMVAGVAMKDPKDMKSMAAPAYSNPWNFYVRGNVILAQGFSQMDVSHFDDNTTSVTLGTDYRFTPNFLIGLTAGYGHTDVTLDDAGSSATVDSYSPGFYASYADHGWYANASGSYIHNAYTQSRVISFLDQTANSAPEGNEGVANLDGGYDFHHGALTFGPLAGLQYTHLTVDGYNETGSDADLSVNSQDADSLRSRLGGRVSFAFSHYGMNFTPHLDATWQHEFMDQSRGITSQFNGGVGSFSVQTTNPSRDSALIDAGLNAEINGTVTVFGDYMVQAGQENYFGQSVQAGVKIGF